MQLFVLHIIIQLASGIGKSFVEEVFRPLLVLWVRVYYPASYWDDVIISNGYLQEQLEQLNIQVHPETQKLIQSIDLTKEDDGVSSE